MVQCQDDLITLGIVRETKNPPDSRVPLTPAQCRKLMDAYNVLIRVESSTNRCINDAEYINQGVEIVDSVADCDVLLGVKEVALEALVAEKAYFFFSHTTKMQPYNRELLRRIVRKDIQLLDYEGLKDESGKRVIAFGRWAGIVGAHNALYVHGRRTGRYLLPRLYKCRDFSEARRQYAGIKFMAGDNSSTTSHSMRIIVTGSGRVGNGAAELLDVVGFRRVTPLQFLTESFTEPIYTQIGSKDIFGQGPESLFSSSFYEDPSCFHSKLLPYLTRADVLVNGIYWDNRAPALFSVEDMKRKDFSVRVIADVTCDIAPVASIPSTLRPTTIPDPVFGFDPHTGEEISAYSPAGIDMMTVDNLPNELPRDASQDFGEQFIKNVLPELLHDQPSSMLYRASITLNGKLNKPFRYLSSYAYDTK